jgi:hypothetical protein
MDQGPKVRRHGETHDVHDVLHTMHTRLATAHLGRNGERDRHGEQRSNATHAATIDPEAQRYKKRPGEELSFASSAIRRSKTTRVPRRWWRRRQVPPFAGHSEHPVLAGERHRRPMVR